MNKKVEKIVGRALVASLAAGVAASVPAKAEELTVDQLYAQAYKATINALNLKTQASINEARAAIKLLPAKLNWAVGEFSKQVDTVQGPKLSAIVRAINAAKASLKQADVDAARTLIEPELPAIWRNSYSSGLDLVQDAVNAKVIAARDKALASQAKADFDAAQALVNELKASKNANVVKYGETIEAQLKAGLKIAIDSYAGVSRREVAVNFNKIVDRASINKDNFKVAGDKANVTSVELSEDGKTVVVTTVATYNQQDKVKVTLAGVKDLDGNALAETTVEATIFDVTIPQALKVEQVGPSKLKVTFSEPVAAASVANFKVDGGQYFIDGSSVTVSGKTATFDLYTTLPVGEHKVAVTGIKDLNNYSLVDTELKFNAYVDNVKPALVKVVKANPGQVVLEFSEDLTLINNAVANFYHTNTSNTASSVAVNGKELTINFASQLPTGTAYLYIAKEVVQDGWANKNDELKGLVLNVTVDTVKPEVKEAKATSDKVIEVTYTEDIQASSAAYKLLDAAGKEVTGNAVTITRPANNKEVLTYTNALAGSNYTLVVEKAKDAAGNEINKISVPVAVTDTTAPTIDATAYLYASKKVVKVTFNEVMKSEDLLNLANYQYAGNYLSAKKVSASITDSGKAVLLDFSGESSITLANGDKLNVGKMRDVAGNVTAAFVSEVTLVNQDVVGIGIDSVKATGKRTVQVTLKDSLASFEADDFVLPELAGKIGAVTFANSNGKGVITYTLTTDLTTLGQLGTTPITVTTAAANTINSANAFGVKVAGAVTAVTAADAIGAEIASAAFTAANKIQVVFTENVKADTLSRFSFTVAGNTVTGLTIDDAKTITITLKDDVATGVKVTVSQALDIEDSVGNVSKGLSKEVTK